MGTVSRLAVREALQRAAAWRLLGLLFERPRPGWHEEVAALSREVEDVDLRAAATLANEATEGVYLATLGPGSRVSPREVAWRGMQDPGRLLSELTGYYTAFAYRPAAEDPVDHVAVEVGFMAYLSLKEALALDRGDDEQAEIVRDALQHFADDHLDVLAAELPAHLDDLPAAQVSAAATVLGRWRPAAASRRSQVLPSNVALGCGVGPGERGQTMNCHIDSFAKQS